MGSIESDIKWIKAELDKVKDPFLIEAFKNLLNYRKSKVEGLNEKLEKVLVSRALKSEDDIKKGRLLSREDMNDKLSA